MTKEEIALQLALSRINDVRPIERANAETINNSLGIEIAKLFNTIYNEIHLDTDSK